MKKDRTLIIAEKPSVARDITKCLDDTFQQKSTHFEGNHYIVSYALGHLLTIADPAEIDERFKSWSLKNLPILPKTYNLKPIKGTKTQLNALEKLIDKPDITTIVNACDAGREGELIFQYIIDYVKENEATLTSSDPSETTPTTTPPKKSSKKSSEKSSEESSEKTPSVQTKSPKKTSKKRPLAEKTIKRLWLQSMTEKSIKEAFQKLRPHDEMKPLSDAAKSRSEADWLVGINSSRGLTSFKSKGGGFFVTPCGRVQTPTLSMLIKREKSIEAFKPESYSNLVAQFINGNHHYEGKWFNPQFKKSDTHPHNRPDRLFDPAKAQAIVEKCTNQYGVVTETAKEVSENCPLLYDLTTLQREANARFSYSAKRTLSIIQSLYERHKMLTYPRTSSRYLPEDYLGEVQKIFKNLAGATLDKDAQHYAKEALEKNYLKNTKRVFDNSKVSDHHAIIPTEKTQYHTLNNDEKKIYTAVVERFIGIFFPAAKSLKTVRTTTIEEETFKTEGKIMLKPGWKAIAGRLEEDKILQPLEQSPPKIPSQTSSDHSSAAAAKNTPKPNEIATENQANLPPHDHSSSNHQAAYTAYCETIDNIKLETKPPNRYTEATLLSAMESAGKIIDDEALREAIKESGIGTPATRAAVIEKLNSDKYIVKQARELIPTSKAFDLFTLIETLEIDELTSPKLTGDWEYKLGLIEKGELSRDHFMEQITSNTVKIVTSIQNYNEEHHRTEAPFSPINGEKFYKHLTYYKNEQDTITIRAIIGGRRMQDSEIATLIEKGKVGPFNDFRSRKGVPFAATIALDDSGKVKLVFLNEDEDLTLEDLQKLPLIGKLYLDDSNVHKTDHAYVSESYIRKEPTGVRVNRFILGKEIIDENMVKMLSGEKCDLIQGFRSARTQRLFDAFLEINDKARIQFSFPPRKSKRQQAADSESSSSESSSSESSPSESSSSDD